MFAIYGALNSKSDVDRLYIPKTEGERGLISFEDWVDLAIRGSKMYLHGSEERLIEAARGEVDGLEGRWFGSYKCFEDREKIRRLGGEKSTWSVFQGDWKSKKWSVLGLAWEWRFEKVDRKSYSGNSESEYKNKSS